MKYNLYLLLLFVLGWTSCSKLIDDVDIPIKEAKLVVHGFIHPGADTLEVRVEKTQAVFATDFDPNDLVVKDARVYITTETGEKHQLNYCDMSKKYLITSALLPVVEGDSYSLLVEHDKFPTARASVTVPYVNTAFEIVKIDSVFYSYKKTYEIVASISDTPNIENYYILFGYIHGVQYEEDENGEIKEEVITQRIFQWDEWISDQKADGLNYVRRGEVNYALENMPKGLHFKLFCIDEHFYRYRDAILAIDNLADNAFATPVSMYSNIENGFGVFSAYSVLAVDVNMVKQ